MKSDELYRLIFSQIINGYSSTHHSFFGEVFIKHFTYLEIGNLDVKYNNFLNSAKSNGLPTYKQQEDYIIKENLWTQKEELNLIQNEKFVQDLKINYSKDYLHSRRLRLKKDIESAEIILNSLRLKKDHFIGMTAEQFANKKLTYYKIINSYFKDINLKEKLVLDTDDEINDKNYDELINLYHEYQEKFNYDNIKRIALSPFFTNIFYLSPDNAYDFYGKPVIQLTTHQADLFQTARYFKHIISENSSIPKEISNNPDELINWIEIRRNATEQKIIGTSDSDEGGGMGSILGANKKDYEMLGIQVSSDNSLKDALKKSGGKLDKDALFKMTG